MPQKALKSKTNFLFWCYKSLEKLTELTDLWGTNEILWKKNDCDFVS